MVLEIISNVRHRAIPLEKDFPTPILLENPM